MDVIVSVVSINILVIIISTVKFTESIENHNINRRKTNTSANTEQMKKMLRETQTLHAGCSKAEPKNFAPPQTSSRGRGAAKI